MWSPNGAARPGARSTRRSTTRAGTSGSRSRDRAGRSTRREGLHERTDDALRGWIGPVGDILLRRRPEDVRPVPRGRPGRPAGRRALSGQAVHLEACPDCREDYVGLRSLVQAGEEGRAHPADAHPTVGGPGEPDRLPAARHIAAVSVIWPDPDMSSESMVDRTRSRASRTPAAPAAASTRATTPAAGPPSGRPAA